MARTRREPVLVIGLGRFGSALAAELVRLEHEVFGVDRDMRLVQAHMDDLTHVVQADATDPEAMGQVVRGTDFTTAVVAIGGDIEASILATHVLVTDLGIPRVVAKAITAAHGRILQRVGAHTMVFPERDMGIRVAHVLSGRAIDYMELDRDFALVEVTAPTEMVGKSLGESAVRSRHDVTVVCVKPPGGAFTYATQNTVIGPDDVLLVAGSTRAVEDFGELS
ncbi:MAG: TrkA family potassium uptake protein [Actinomycetota bacterium]